MGWMVALFVGAVVAPWLLTGKQIRIGFEEGGATVGLGVWFGAALIPTAVILLAYWIGGFIF